MSAVSLCFLFGSGAAGDVGRQPRIGLPFIDDVSRSHQPPAMQLGITLATSRSPQLTMRTSLIVETVEQALRCP